MFTVETRNTKADSVLVFSQEVGTLIFTNLLRAERNEAFHRTDILVRPCGKPRGATDEDVRRTSQSAPLEVYSGQHVASASPGMRALRMGRGEIQSNGILSPS